MTGGPRAAARRGRDLRAQPDALDAAERPGHPRPRRHEIRAVLRLCDPIDHHRPLGDPGTRLADGPGIAQSAGSLGITLLGRVGVGIPDDRRFATALCERKDHATPAAAQEIS